MQPIRKQRWQELTSLLNRLDRSGVSSLTVEEVKQLCRLYRQVSIDLSRARTRDGDPELIEYLNLLAARAHGQVYAARRLDVRPFFTFLIRGFPRLIRRQARPILIAAALFLGTSLVSFLAVARDPEIAYSLFSEQIVEYENLRLEQQQGEYRGNFNFPFAQSPLVAVAIIFNNVFVAMKMFALGALICLPGVFILVFNGRMLGTLSGVVWLHGYLADFYSLILCHGVLELTAICISGGAGLMLGWAVISPGRLSRREALKRAARDAFGLLGGCVVLLIIAGHIEAYITPHFAQPVRWLVAFLSALFLFIYFGWAGRSKRAQIP
jgi:uncharacterized membrane protein SpoIIM required for sporulation